jgi:Ca2+-transporting ATPase
MREARSRSRTNGHRAQRPADLSAADISRSDSEALFRLLHTSRGGLTPREAARRLNTYGRNELARPRRRNPLAAFAGNFTHLLALLLWIAAFLAFVGRLPELGWAIIAVILINGVFSFAQEYRASQLLEALQRRVLVPCRIRRAGVVMEVDSPLLVPGDVVLLAEGERIPADCRVITSAGLEVDESALTGESAPVVKTQEPSTDSQLEDPTLPNLLYAGTLVVHGDAEAMVWASREHTQFGTISELTASLEQAAGPLRQEIEGLARVTAAIAIMAGLVIWAISTVILDRAVSQGFVFAIGVLVALVPEGLLPTLSLSLALGVQRMARRNVLVRRLSAIEALGATQVICTDKTGTLTQNRMVVEQLWLPQGEYAIEHSSVSHAGLRSLGGRDDPARALEMLRSAALASNATVAFNTDGGMEASGDPTELAIVEAAVALGVKSEASRLLELPFDAYRRMMSSLNEEASGPVLHTKGAPDAVLERSSRVLDGASLDEDTRQRFLAQAEAYADAGLRVLGVARRRVEAAADDRDKLEMDLEVLGLIAMMDPIRPQAREAVTRCREAGIRVIIITGDHPGTAVEVAKRTGIAPDGTPRVVTGSQLELMTPAALHAALEEDVVFARTTPVQKLAIVTALQEMDYVVAVIGDGVNDAPSLRQADVGVAMGKSGTDVAREAADIVLLDDNFGTIVDAVEEGRAIFANIRKFVTYVFTSNVAELAPFAAFVLTGIPLPLKIVQVLAVDLGTDLVPALALGAEPPEPGVLNERPRAKGAPLLDRSIFLRTFALLGPIEALLGLAGYFFVYWSSGWRPSEALSDSGDLYALATTMTFAAIVAGQVGCVLVCRSFHVSAFAMPITRNPLLIVALIVEVTTLLVLVYVPPLQSVFDFASPGVREWLFVMVLLPLLPLLDEARKLILRRSR